MRPRRFLILDDNEDFCNALKDGLVAEGHHVLLPKIEGSAIIRALEEKPTDILLDMAFKRGASARDLLSFLKENGVKIENFRIWIVSGMSTVDVSTLQEDFSSVQSTWLAKPFEIKELLSMVDALQKDKTEKTDNFFNWDDLRKDGFFEQFFWKLPMACRIINKEGDVIHTNEHWKAARNQPNPKHFLHLMNGKEAHIQELWGPLPGTPGLEEKSQRDKHPYKNFGWFSLRSFALPSFPGLLMQVASPLLHQPDLDLDKLIDKIFSAMADAGFARGRFYRIIQVPDSDGLIELYKSNGSWTIDKLDNGMMRPLSGVILERLKKYEKKIADQENRTKFLFEIRSVKEEKEFQKNGPKSDPGIQYWDRFVDIDQLDSWLEVPVFSRNKSKDGQFFPKGLFVFDRLGKEGFLDGKPNAVEETQVNLVEETLYAVTGQVGAALLRKKEEDKKKIYERLEPLDQTLFEYQSTDEIAKSVLETAIKLTNCAGGFWLTKFLAPDRLEVIAAEGKVQKQLVGAEFSIAKSDDPLSRAWNMGKDVFVSDYKGSETKISIPFKGDVAQTEVIRDLEKNLGSLAVIPISGKKEVLGSLCLQADATYHFKEMDAWALDILCWRVRNALHSAQLAEHRQNWEHSFVHMLRTDLLVVKQSLLRASEGTQPDPVLMSRALRHADNAHFFSQHFLEVNRDPSPNFDVTTPHPFRIVERYFENWKEETDWNEQKIISTNYCPESGDCLVGPEIHITAVLHTLLHNAWKFSGKKANIRVEAKNEGDYWRLDLVNPGWMSPEEYRLRFVAFCKTQNFGSGAHVGLSNSRKIAGAYNGTLNLENVEIAGKNHVQAVLLWPLSKGDKK